LVKTKKEYFGVSKTSSNCWLHGCAKEKHDHLVKKDDLEI
jgi:hypothetical protein